MKKSSCVNQVAKRLLLAMLTIFPWLAGCAQSGQLPKPPISLPFEVQKAGSRVETDMRIVDAREYQFHLRYLYDKNNVLDAQRVSKLAGSSDLGIDGKPLKLGVPVVLKFYLRQIDTTGEKLILEQEISDMQVVAYGSGYRLKKIISLKLSPGHYRVNVESLKDAPELIGTPVEFFIAFISKY